MKGVGASHEIQRPEAAQNLTHEAANGPQNADPPADRFEGPPQEALQVPGIKRGGSSEEQLQSIQKYLDIITGNTATDRGHDYSEFQKTLSSKNLADLLNNTQENANKAYAQRGVLSKLRDALSFIFGKSDATKLHENLTKTIKDETAKAQQMIQAEKEKAAQESANQFAQSSTKALTERFPEIIKDTAYEEELKTALSKLTQDPKALEAFQKILTTIESIEQETEKDPAQKKQELSDALGQAFIQISDSGIDPVQTKTINSFINELFIALQETTHSP